MTDRITQVLSRIETDMKAIVASNGDPSAAARRIWSEAFAAASESRDVVWPMWLMWGELTDRVDDKPKDPTALHAAMRRAAAEWLALPKETAARRAYFDRWLYEELGYDRPNDSMRKRSG